MTGTVLNMAGICLGGIAGLTLARSLSERTQRNAKIVLGALVVYTGLRMTWDAVGGTFFQVIKQLGIALFSLSLGNLTGTLLRFQRTVNRLGKLANERLRRAQSGESMTWKDGAKTTALLYCLGPLGVVGSIQQGLNGEWQTLGLKGAMDGLAGVGFVALFGWPVLLSTIAVLILQGTLTLATQHWVAPLLLDRNLIDAVQATSGLILAAASLAILDLRKIPLMNLLPALIYAPLLTRWWGAT